MGFRQKEQKRRLIAPNALEFWKRLKVTNSETANGIEESNQMTKTRDEVVMMAKAMAKVDIDAVGYDDDSYMVWLDEAQAAYDALITAGAIPKWRPIEEAPRDTPAILNVVGYPWGTVGVWNEPSKKWCYVQLQADLYDGAWIDTSFENEYEAEVDSKGLPNVTHFMLIPTPPQNNRGDE